MVAAPPQRVEIGYEIARNGSVLAEVNQRLEHDGRSYRLSETWKGMGILSLRGEVTRSSEGAVVADGLRPQKFEDRRRGRDTLHVEFDPAARTATLLRQDQLSFIWTLAFAPPREAVTLSVSDGKRVASSTYRAEGRERVKTPAGDFDALKLVKRTDNPQDKATEVWLAVDRQYIPVRILVIDKDGTRLDQVAVKISVQ
ncbi:MAG: DUF3108 domain-containing protein [Pseudomonadota bacterium]